MQNYFPNGSDKKNFILNYTINDDEIVVRYGDNSLEVVPYSIQSEKETLNRMREQVIDSKRFLGDIRRKAEIFGKLLIDVIILLAMFIATKLSIGLSIIPTTIGFVIFPIVIAFTAYKTNKYQKLGNDIRKHLLFLDNEDCLNVTIRNDKEATSDLSNSLKNKLWKEGKKIEFSLNTIDGIEYGELKRIYKHVSLSKCRRRKKDIN